MYSLYDSFNTQSVAVFPGSSAQILQEFILDIMKAIGS